MKSYQGAEADTMKASEFNWWRYIRVPDTRTPWQWAAGEMRLKGSPHGDVFNAELTPWLKEPLEAFTDNRNREITLQCAVQGGKSTMLTVAAAWAMAHDPAPMMINCQTDDDAKDYAKERFRPSIESVPEIAARLPDDKSHNSICSISLSDMFVIIQGANMTNLQSKSIRWLFNDEVAFWKDGGLLDHARKRATMFWNRRIVNVSTAGDTGSDMDMAFEAGDKREWNFGCIECSRPFEPSFELLKFDDARKADGNWDYYKVKDVAHLECPHCAAKIYHTERNAKRLNDGARYVATNPTPRPGHVSFRFNALVLPPSVLSWGELAVEFLTAKALFDAGHDVAMREFKTKRQAKSWDALTARHAEEIKVTDSDYETPSNLRAPEFWPGEMARFMAVDVQQDHLWAGVRAFNESGESRLVTFRRLLDWDDVKALGVECGVEPEMTVIDSGYRTGAVYEACCVYGWRALRGEDRRGFTVTQGQGKFERCWKEGDPVLPTTREIPLPRRQEYCPMAYWSNPTVKDFLHRLKTGKGAYWQVPRDIGADYLSQIDGERKLPKLNKATGRTEMRWVSIGKRGNHAWDVECMLLVCAMAYGVLNVEAVAMDESKGDG